MNFKPADNQILAFTQAQGREVMRITGGGQLIVHDASEAAKLLMAEWQKYRGHTLESIWSEGEANHAEYSTMDNNDADIRFLALALCGEAGELANFVKKEWRDGVEHGEEIDAEIADVVLYAVMLAAKRGMKPQDLLDLMAHKQRVFRDKMAKLKLERA